MVVLLFYVVFSGCYGWLLMTVGGGVVESARVTHMGMFTVVTSSY